MHTHLRGPTSKGKGREGRLTCLPPRFDNPGYGPGLKLPAVERTLIVSLLTY